MNRVALAKYVLRRLVSLVCVLIVTSFGVFSLLYLAPGSVESALVGPGQTITPEMKEALSKEHNLDEPFLVQYGLWAKQAMTLDFGTSYRTGENVTEAVTERLWVTAPLALISFALTMTVGVALGIISAVRKNTIVDQSISGFVVIGISTPVFVTGILLATVFAVYLPWLPAYGGGDGGVGDSLQHLLLPAIALSASACAVVVRLTRAGMVQALEQDHVTFARAKGISGARLIRTHVLRNAMIPIVTSAGAILAYFIAGTALVEVVFGLPGIGDLLITSIEYHDVPMLQGIAMIIAVGVVLVNLVTDILYSVIDPRIRLGEK